MGELAALLTAFFWAFSSLFFTTAGKKVGSLVVNRLRLLFGVVLLGIAHFILQGQLLPLDASAERWFWLGLSGIFGLVIGDGFLLQAYVMIGTRIATLIMAINPIISTILAWIFLSETLSIPKVIGITLAIVGISVVVLERGNGNLGARDRRQYVLGILAAVAAAFAMSLGLVFAKKGLVGEFPSISGVIIRMLVSLLVVWVMTFAMGHTRRTLQALRDRAAIRPIALGSVAGPFIGVWLALIAVQSTYVGIASTLMSLTPIIVLPFVRYVFKEPVSLRAVFGTAVSLAGVFIIFVIA